MYRLLIAFLFLFGFYTVSAQTTIIYDTNFQAFLAERFPNLLNSNKELIDAKAAALIGNLDCANRNIKSLSGIEKFKKISQLFCSGNQLTNLDSIQYLNQLTLLDCHDNPLGRLPDLRELSNLTYLWCSGCGLTQALDLTSNPLITTLNCYTNEIPAIIGLESLSNLTALNCYGNPLKALPSLKALTKLVILQCFDNQLTALPDLSSLTSLQTLIAGGNQISVLPDLSNLTKLKTIKMWNNKLSTLPDFSNQLLLENCEISYNKLTLIPDFKNNLNLTNLDLQGNRIQDIPDLSHLAMLASVKLQNNQLTFQDLLPLLNLASLKQFSYSPQAEVGRADTLFFVQSEDVVIRIDVDSIVKTNRYVWLKNGQVLNAGYTGAWPISNIQLADSGAYTYNITNTLLPSLTLTGKPLKVSVKNCLDISAFNIKVNEYECNKGASLQIQPSSISGGTPPYRFSLTSELAQHPITPNGSLFDHLYESNYTIAIKDSRNCSAYREVRINGKKPDDCETLVIAYEDNKSNYLSFEDKGIAKVYNKSGKLVTSFATPSNWDGSLENGAVVPGFYILELNGKHFQVTVIK